MAKTAEATLVTLTDPRAIRALAHPARMQVIDALYSSGQAMTATELGELTGLSASAMSYHLRALERFGVVRRDDAKGDARERPWIRAARALNVAPSVDGPSRASLSASSLLVSSAMERDLASLVAAIDRKKAGDTSVPLDSVTRYLRESLVLTPAQAKRLFKDIDALVAPYREDVQTDQPARAGRLVLTFTSVADPRRTGTTSAGRRKTRDAGRKTDGHESGGRRGR
jgi:DNA-binding transcriptional ArsR family regulator